MNGAEAREEELHHERRADRVREARVLGPWKGERGDSELPYTPKPLHLRRVDEAWRDDLFFRLEGNETMNGITQNHRASRDITRITPPASRHTSASRSKLPVRKLAPVCLASPGDLRKTKLGNGSPGRLRANL